MERYFNTAGPCEPDLHYMLPPEERLTGVRRLIDARLYFVLHAPRQTGKTTYVQTLARALTEEGKYAALHASCERGQTARANVDAGVTSVVRAIEDAARKRLPEELRPPACEETEPESRLIRFLTAWSEACPRPVVLFLDEIDALLDETLLSVLRQLREGYADRPDCFPYSLSLVGLRDVRDYKIRIRPEQASMGTASPFNIKTRSLVLGDFSEQEVADLLAQHTGETGQVFEPAALERVVYFSQGQPWLVNSLAQLAVWDLVPDPRQPITAAHIDEAAERLILARGTHIDSLIDKLREPRVRKVIEPIVAGDALAFDVLEDDLRYVEDLGLVHTNPQLAIANPIYAEVIPRALSWSTQVRIHQESAWYLDEAGRLDMDALFEAFADFWREHGEPLIAQQPYHEAAPHLVLLAFLQRLVNGGGRISREYAVGMGRMDLLLRWPTPGGEQLEAIELKVWRNRRPDPLERGLKQLGGYLKRLGLAEGTLVIFDRREGVPPIEDRTELQEERFEGLRVRVLRA